MTKRLGEQEKLKRLINLIKLLKADYITSIELSERLKCSERTIHRYISLFRNTGFIIDVKKGESKYKIITSPL